MENASDALKIAFAVLMFVAALSLSISSFSQATTAINSIITMRDRETDYMYVTPSKNSNRIVGVETVIPTMYKAYKENFKIVFLNSDGTDLPLYYYTDSFGKRATNPKTGKTEINYIDLEGEVMPSATEAIAHLDILLSQRQGSNVNENKYYWQFMEDKTQGLYDYLQDKKFEEVLGEYYQEDAAAGYETEGLEINKTKKRVITYILQTN